MIELLTGPGALLDVGCSLGYFLEAAASRGWSAAGVDISRHATREARCLGFDVRTGTLEQAGYPEAMFDCVSMWDVLEHVAAPVAHMLEVRRILKPGGIAAIGTPNIAHIRFRLERGRWRHLKPAEHVFYFCPTSMRALLSRTGFELLDSAELRKRAFRSGLRGGLGAVLSALDPTNDVMTVYAVRDGRRTP